MEWVTWTQIHIHSCRLQGVNDSLRSMAQCMFRACGVLFVVWDVTFDEGMVRSFMRVQQNGTARHAPIAMFQ
eukprot:scaffold111460_cov20-Prasinocladus_malaysianus.AAC.1